MAEYAISSQYGPLFGMDVHARSTTVRGFDFATGETKVKRFGDCPAPAEIAVWMQDGFAGSHYAAYESAAPASTCAASCAPSASDATSSPCR